MLRVYVSLNRFSRIRLSKHLLLAVSVLLVVSWVMLLYGRADRQLNRIPNVNYREIRKTEDEDNQKSAQFKQSDNVDKVKDSSRTKSENVDSLQYIDVDYLIYLIKLTFPKHGDPKYGEFNETMSHAIPLDRNITDFTPSECKKHRWLIPDMKVSIVIPFKNEPWSTLLRTLISILRKTPLKYLEEIILVDDHSTREYLLAPLERLLSPFKHISVLRTPYKMGPASSRNYGTRHTKGDVLIFFDSHCEVSYGWIEPLLDAIAKDRSRIVAPVIDFIPSSTMKPFQSARNAKTQMTWTLGATFGKFRRSVLATHNLTDGLPQPSLMGAVFAVDKQYYLKIGGLGDYFVGWGGEDVDLSIKSWLCGGGLFLCRCSHVGHVYKAHPYRHIRSPLQNVRLMAEAWLEEYLPITMCALVNGKFLPKVDTSVLKSTFELKKKLQCKPFKWYIKYVFPDLEVPQPNTTFFKLHTPHKVLTVDSDNKTLSFKSSSPESCSVSVSGNKIVCLDKCLTVENKSLYFKTCDSRDNNQNWRYDRGRITPYYNDRLCVVYSERARGSAVLNTCEANTPKILHESRFAAGCITKDKLDKISSNNI